MKRESVIRSWWWLFLCLKRKERSLLPRKNETNVQNDLSTFRHWIHPKKPFKNIFFQETDFGVKRDETQKVLDFPLLQPGSSTDDFFFRKAFVRLWNRHTWTVYISIVYYAILIVLYGWWWTFFKTTTTTTTTHTHAT